MKDFLRTCRSFDLRRRLLLPGCLLLFALLASSASTAQPLWEKLDNGFFGADVRSFGFDVNGGTWAAAGSGLYRFDRAERLWRFVDAIQLTSLAVMPDGTIIGASAVGSMVRSTDGGRSWLQSGNVYQVDRIIIAPGGALFAASSSVITRSLDTGRSWQIVAWSSATESPYFTAAAPAPGIIFSNSFARTRRSTDNGDTWETIVTPAPFWQMIPAGNGDLIATSYQGVYRSSDTGRTWLKASGTIIASLVEGIDGNVYATEGGGRPGALLRSKNYGINWTWVGTDADLIAPAPDGSLWVARGDTLLYSSDGGTSWQAEIRGDGNLPFIGSITTAPDRSLVAGSGGTIYRSTDNGDTWSLASAEPAGHLIGVDSSGGLYTLRMQEEWFPGGDERTISSIHQSTDRGIRWRGLASGGRGVTADLTHPRILALGSSGNGMMGGIRGGGVAVSTDAGRTWKGSTLGLATNAVAVTPAGTILAGIFEIEETEWIRRLYASRDSGASWEILFDTLEVARLKVAPNGTIYLWGTGYEADSSMGIRQQSLLLRSIDDGRSWDTLFRAIYLDEIYIDASSRVYLGLQRSSPSFSTLWSEDNGESFETFPQIHADANIRFLETFEGGDLIASSRDSLYRWDHEGKKWHAIHWSLPATIIGSAMEANGYLFVSTMAGIFRLPLRTLGLDATSEPAAIGLHIAAPRPNPLATTSTVLLKTAAPADLRITLSDLLGRELRVMHDGIMPAGATELTVERGDLPSGTYLVVVRSKEKTTTRMLVVE